MHDLVSLGEVLLRLAIPSPARFETAHQLDLQIGGAEANVAAACARLGLRTAWISALPANPWGERIRRELTGHGVDCGLVRMTPNARVGTYFLEYGVPPRPVRVLYDRRDSAFARLTPADVDWAPLRSGRLAPKATISLQQGAEGSTVLDGGRLYRPRLRPTVQVVDPIGAGDAYAAGFLWAILRGRELQDAVDAGTAVGALKCSTWGDIALVSKADVADLLAGGPDVRR